MRSAVRRDLLRRGRRRACRPRTCAVPGVRRRPAAARGSGCRRSTARRTRSPSWSCRTCRSSRTSSSAACRPTRSASGRGRVRRGVLVSRPTDRGPGASWRATGERDPALRRYVVAAPSDEEFAELVETAWPGLYRTAYLLLGEHQLAEDLVQTSLAKTYAAWGKVREPGAAHGYARVVLANTAASWFRRRSWRNELPSSDVARARDGHRAVRPAGRPRGAGDPAAASARGGGAALLRRPERPRGRGRARGERRHGQEPDLRRAGQSCARSSATRSSPRKMGARHD